MPKIPLQDLFNELLQEGHLVKDLIKKKSLSDMGLVARSDFEESCQLLSHLQNRVEELEKKISEKK